jgi:hypothetical protein
LRPRNSTAARGNSSQTRPAHEPVATCHPHRPCRVSAEHLPSARMRQRYERRPAGTSGRRSKHSRASSRAREPSSPASRELSSRPETTTSQSPRQQVLRQSAHLQRYPASTSGQSTARLAASDFSIGDLSPTPISSRRQGVGRRRSQGPWQFLGPPTCRWPLAPATRRGARACSLPRPPAPSSRSLKRRPPPCAAGTPQEPPYSLPASAAELAAIVSPSAETSGSTLWVDSVA